MNVHVPMTIQSKYPQVEFRGVPRQFNGRTVIRSTNHFTQMNFLYSFEEDFFWLINSGFSNMDVPDWFIQK